MRVLIFGDSITQGYWDKSKGGWVARIRQEYDALKVDGEEYDPPAIFNLGVSGDSTDEVVRRFEVETKARLDDDLVIVFALGVNDSRLHGTKEFSTPERYQQNLETLLTQAQDYTQKIIFLGLTPCVEERTNPVAWNSTCYTNDRIERFNSVLEEFCNQHNVMFIDVLTPFKDAQQTTELLPDGVHPNDEGHELIAKLVKPCIQEKVA